MKRVRTYLPTWERSRVTGTAWRLSLFVSRQSRRQVMTARSVEWGGVSPMALRIRYWNWCFGLWIGHRVYWWWHFTEIIPTPGDWR